MLIMGIHGYFVEFFWTILHRVFLVNHLVYVLIFSLFSTLVELSKGWHTFLYLCLHLTLKQELSVKITNDTCMFDLWSSWFTIETCFRKISFKEHVWMIYDQMRMVLCNYIYDEVLDCKLIMPWIDFGITLIFNGSYCFFKLVRDSLIYTVNVCILQWG